MLPLPEFNEASTNLGEFGICNTNSALPHKPRGHSSAFSSVDAGAYKAPHIRVFSLSGLEHHHPFPLYCPSHATSLTCVLASPSQSRRNNSCWCSACSTSHVLDAPAPVVGLRRGADSADYYVANWGSKGVRPACSQRTCIKSRRWPAVHLWQMLSYV